MSAAPEPVEIAAFYKFFALTDLPAVQERVKAALRKLGAYGTVLVAPEGINGTIAGVGIARSIAALEALTGSGPLEVKYSAYNTVPFGRLRVRIKREIVTLKAPEADPTQHVGHYVEPKDWNALIDDPEVLVIDTRNAYEVRIGTFKRAIDPKTQSFSELKDYVKRELKDVPRSTKLAMFCTGGIRCEKSTALMIAEGFEQVFHLRGGILNYLEHVPEHETRWEGGCFVFDHRVAVTHGVVPSGHTMCPACGAPLAAEDRAHPSYVESKQCGYCAHEHIALAPIQP